MLKIICDICGNQATIGLDASRYGVYVPTENLHMYKHHLCLRCAEKLGLVDYIKERQAESERCLKQNEIIPCEIQKNKEAKK